MNSIRVLIICFLLIGLGSVDSNAATGWAFMSIPNGTREIAMGETGVSQARDASAAWWNPAHIGQSHTGFWFQGFKWIEDGSGSFGGAHLQTDWGGVAAYYVNHGMEGFEVRDRPGDPQGEFTLRQAVLGAGIAYHPMKKLSVGVVYKGGYEDIFGDRLDVWNILDLGVLLKTNDFNFGFSVANIGFENPGDDAYPTTYRLGMSRDYKVGPVDLIVAFDGIAEREDHKYYHFGFESNWSERIFIRAGYMAGHESRNFSGGLGFIYNQFNVDFAITPFENDLGTTWRVGLGMKI